ncbi:MAG: ParB N-terminal domain-containing protein [Syntrophus sp. (in: bacteria)]
MSIKLYYVETGKLRANPDNMFPPLPPDEYEDLKASIALHGIQEPLIVVPEENDVYTVQAGHNRWRVAKELFLRTVPCIESSHKMFEAVMDTEIFRRMLSKEERAKYKELKGSKQEEMREKHLTTHLLPELMELYQSKKISMNVALFYATLPESGQQEQWTLLDQKFDFIEIITPEDPAEKENRLKEKAELMTQIEDFQVKLKTQENLMKGKENDLKQLRSQQDKAREHLEAKEEELNKAKEDAYNKAGETLRAEVAKEVETAKEQVKTYMNAVMEKDLEIDELKEQIETAKRLQKDAVGKTNEAWVAARVWQDGVAEHLKKLFSPDAMNDHLHAAKHSVVAVSRLLNASGYNWEKTIREKAMSELKILRTTIDDLLNVLPNTAVSQMPQMPQMRTLPMPAELQESQ